MSNWPEKLKAGPIREWPGSLTRQRRVAPFRGANGATTLTKTLVELTRELEQLRARDVELLVALPPEKFRLDGRPRAGAVAEHPGIILTFTIPGVGQVSYPCDTFTKWEDNLRAVTLSLEALRRVDRYGVTKRAEQYRGFLAIESGSQPGFFAAEDAEKFLRDWVGDDYDARPLRAVLREAQRTSHPDMSGDPETFHKVSEAERVLREAGRL